MNDAVIPDAVLRARAKGQRRISLIWAIPLVAALIGAWLAWRAYAEQGPTITITFVSAEGLEAGKSHVKHKDVDVGLVNTVVLSPDLSHVIVTVQMTKESEPLLTSDAQFWVVRPRLFAGSISGLDTLVSGSYLQIAPGDAGAGAKRARSFVGLEEPPLLHASVPGRSFLLKADKLGAIGPGSPIFFRDLQVGQVLGYDLGKYAEEFTIHAFVQAPYDDYIREGSRFWNASGVSVKLGADGVKVELESIRALLLGGVAFDTPPAARTASLSPEGAVFRLFDDRASAVSSGYQSRWKLVSYFSGSARGLAVGAPVELHGIQIGQVTGMRLEFDPVLMKVRVEVEYEVQPERIGNVSQATWPSPEQALRQMVALGLRAQLRSSNMLTGQLLVAFDLFPEAESAEVKRQGDLVVVPSTPQDLADLMRTVDDIMGKIAKLPLDEMGKSIQDTLSGVSKVANNPDIQQAIASLRSTMATAQDVVKGLQAGVQPALKQLPAITAGLQDTVVRTNRLLGSVDDGYGDNSKFHRDIDRLLAQLNETARSMRILADLLDQHPEALIRGRADAGK